MSVKPSYSPASEKLQSQLSLKGCITKPPKAIDVDNLFHCMSGVDYGQGTLEDIEGTVSNTSLVLARLLDMLREKEIITEQDIRLLLSH